MKQYRVYFRREGSEKWAALEPGAHAALYDNPEVQSALKIVREQPAIEAVCCRHDGDLFNIVVFEQEALAPLSFVLGDS